MVSIIMAVYNGETYIEEAIKSILNQTYKNIELIIIDDGSTDGTKKIALKYPVIYHYQKNKGPSSARNKGIELAKGKYVAFIDSDDIYLKNKIERQVEFLEKSSFDIVFNDVIMIDDKGEDIGVLKSELYDENFKANILFRQIIPCPPSIMLRRRCFDNIQYPEDYINAEDYKLIIELSNFYKFGYIRECLYLYRRHKYNLTNNHKKQVDNEIKIVKDMGVNTIKNRVNESNYTKLKKKILLGQILYKIQLYKEAINELYGIKDEEAMFYLGNSYFKLGDIKIAKNIYEKIIFENEKMIEVYNNLGVISKLNSNLKEAKEYFRKALEFVDGYGDPKYNLENIEGKDFRFTNRKLRNTIINYER